MSNANDTRARAARLRLMAFDVDGVMTDGGLTYADDGSESKTFNVRDGLGLKLLQDAGIEVAVITGRQSPCVAARMDNLGIAHLQQGIGDKLASMQALLDRLGIVAEEAGYMGDDLIDLRVMAACGFSATPSDGHRLARQHAFEPIARSAAFQQQRRQDAVFEQRIGPIGLADGFEHQRQIDRRGARAPEHRVRDGGIRFGQRRRPQNRGQRQNADAVFAGSQMLEKKAAVRLGENPRIPQLRFLPGQALQGNARQRPVLLVQQDAAEGSARRQRQRTRQGAEFQQIGNGIGPAEARGQIHGG